jgi:hypothetical protein
LRVPGPLMVQQRTDYLTVVRTTEAGSLVTGTAGGFSRINDPRYVTVDPNPGEEEMKMDENDSLSAGNAPGWRGQQSRYPGWI